MYTHSRDRKLLYYALVHMIDPIAREVLRMGIITYENINSFTWREKYTYKCISLIVRKNDWIVEVIKNNTTVAEYRFAKTEDETFLPEWIRNLETDITHDLK